MKLIKSKYEFVEQSSGLEGIYKAIELAGRVSHKSEANIKEDSAKTFVDNMIKLGHNATLEFGTIYLYFPWVCMGGLDAKYSHNKYSKVTFYSNIKMGKKKTLTPIEYGKAGRYVTTNMRVLVENNWLDDLKYMCEPTKYHEKRYCVKFICDRGVSHEFVRHRTMSFMQESTRYCNYSNGRFNKEITCIIPNQCNLKEGYYGYELEIGCNIHGGNPVIKGYLYSDKIVNTEEEAEKCISINDEYTPFILSLVKAEEYYFSLLDNGWKPQQARQVLPNALKTELYMCGFASDWKHFFELRDSKFAHPDAFALANPLHKEFIEKGYINE